MSNLLGFSIVFGANVACTSVIAGDSDFFNAIESVVISRTCNWQNSKAQQLKLKTAYNALLSDAQKSGRGREAFEAEAKAQEMLTRADIECPDAATSLAETWEAIGLARTMLGSEPSAQGDN